MNLFNSRLLSGFLCVVCALFLNACSLMNGRSADEGGSVGAEQATPVAQQSELIDLPLPESVDTGIMPENTVVAILQDVEINYETPLQLKQICTALDDMATLSTNDIKNKRYADFNGNQGKWTLLQVLYAYFLPAQKVNLQNLYEDVEKPLSREIVRQTLLDMQEYCDTKTSEQDASGW